MGVLRAQWFLRLLDFLSVSMVLPTLEQYLLAVGGHVEDYYTSLGLTTVMMMLTSFCMGLIVDRTGSVRMLYVWAAIVNASGNLLYAAADAVPMLKAPATIVFARALVGSGSASYALVFVFLARVAKPDERQSWVVQFAMTRSLGLFAGPAITVLLAWVCNPGGDPDIGSSIFGTFALPGLFLGAGNLLGLLWLILAWREPPAVPCKGHGDMPPSWQSGGACEGAGLRRIPKLMLARRALKCCRESHLMPFVSKKYVIALYLAGGIAPFVANAAECLVPIVATHSLGWVDGQGTGSVLMAIAVVVFFNQALILRLKQFTEDRQLLVLGCAGMPVTLVLGLCAWFFYRCWACHSGSSWGHVNGPASNREAASVQDSILVMAPFVMVECWLPYVTTSTMTVYTRIVAREIPHRMGVLQALMSNVPMLGCMLSPAWDAWSYSEPQMGTEGLPWTGLLGLALAGLVPLIAVSSTFMDMGAMDTSEPLHPWAAPAGPTPEGEEGHQLCMESTHE